jgi:hypothetical protein
MLGLLTDGLRWSRSARRATLAPEKPVRLRDAVLVVVLKDPERLLDLILDRRRIRAARRIDRVA